MGSTNRVRGFLPSFFLSVALASGAAAAADELPPGSVYRPRTAPSAPVPEARTPAPGSPAAQALPHGHPALTPEQIAAAERIVAFQQQLREKQFSSCSSQRLSRLMVEYEDFVAQIPGFVADGTRRSIERFKSDSVTKNGEEPDEEEIKIFTTYAENGLRRRYEGFLTNFYGQALFDLVACDRNIPSEHFIKQERTQAAAPGPKGGTSPQ